MLKRVLVVEMIADSVQASSRSSGVLWRAVGVLKVVLKVVAGEDGLCRIDDWGWLEDVVFADMFWFLLIVVSRVIFRVVLVVV